MLLAALPPRVVAVRSCTGGAGRTHFWRPLRERARARSVDEDRPSRTTPVASRGFRLCIARPNFPLYRRGDYDDRRVQLGHHHSRAALPRPLPQPGRGRRDGEPGGYAARHRALPLAATLLALTR